MSTDLPSISAADSDVCFRSLFENNHTVMLIIDPLSGVIVDANPAAAAFYGYPRNDLNGQHITNISLRNPEALRASFLRALEAPVQRLMSRHRMADGSIRDVEVHRGPFRTGDRALIHVVVHDMTDQSRQEQERRKADEVMRLQSAALNAAANAVLIADVRGAIVWVNPAFTALTGYPADEALGRNPRELVKSGVEPATLYAELWRTITAGNIWRGELTNRRKDGGLYSEYQTITPVRDESGAITHFIAIKRDLTEQKRLEAQVLQSQKMEVVGRLAGGIAHDFNNLLTVINGTAELAADDLAPADPVREAFEEIGRAGARAAALTGQLLAFSRKQINHPSVFSPGVLAGEMRGMLQRLLGEDIRLSVESDETLHCVRADRGQLEQVVMNLAINARDAMPRGGDLTIGLHNTTVDGLPYVTLTVRDSGTGMDEATRAHLFEPFFTTKEVGRGTGLGLSTVYGIVRQSGGTITVDTAPGLGTTFTISLPGLPAAAAPAVAAAAAQAQPAGGRETILVVEDEAPLRALATRILEASGYQVLVAEDGLSAIDLIESHRAPIDLVLSDVVLPGIDGVELATRVAARRPGTKIVFMSGYSNDARIYRAAFDEASYFLAKPFSRTELLDKVREQLDA